MRIVVDLPVHPASLERLYRLPGMQVRFAPQRAEGTPISPEQLQDLEVLFSPDPTLEVAHLPQAKLIQISSVGFDHLLGKGLEQGQVTVCNARGVHDTAIAEWNIGMLIALTRDLPGMLRHQRDHAWVRTVRQQAEIRGQTLGLWGYGGIGRETARLAKQLGLRVHVLTRHGVQPRDNTYCLPGAGDPEGLLPDAQFTAGQELEFLRDLDALAITMPLSPHTRGIIGERELRAMKPTACVLNPSRGPIIEEQALLAALRNSWIGGAALDTHYYYPLPPDHPLWDFPNVILTPHISGSDGNPHFFARVWDVFVQNVERLHAGKQLLNIVAPDDLRG